ncbi:hypothetical protein GCM10009738_11990 [Kitasatospora viridis]
MPIGTGHRAHPLVGAGLTPVESVAAVSRRCGSVAEQAGALRVAWDRSGHRGCTRGADEGGHGRYGGSVGVHERFPLTGVVASAEVAGPERCPGSEDGRCPGPPSTFPDKSGR